MAFTVDQATPTEPDKSRCCYFAKASKENARIRTHEKVEVRGLTGLIDFMVFFMIAFQGTAPHCLSGHYEHVFEQLAVHPSECPHSYFHLVVDM